jgi:hypothetical protein
LEKGCVEDKFEYLHTSLSSDSSSSNLPLRGIAVVAAVGGEDGGVLSSSSSVRLSSGQPNSVLNIAWSAYSPAQSITQVKDAAHRAWCPQKVPPSRRTLEIVQEAISGL